MQDGFLSFHSPLSYMSAVDEKQFDNVNNDDKELLALGYKPSFKREFTNLATVSHSKCKVFGDFNVDLLPQISFAFSILVREIIR